jgi:hypothetical protein
MAHNDEYALAPLGTLDVRELKEDFAGAIAAEPHRDQMNNFLDVANAAIQLGVEICGTSIRSLARKLRDTGPISFDGWTLANAPLKDAWHIGFTAEREGEPGGWLYNCLVYPEQSKDGKAAEKARADEMRANGADETKILFSRLDLKGADKVEHTEYFLIQDECPRLETFVVCGYAKDGGMRPLYDGYGKPSLGKIIDENKFKGYMTTGIIEADPSLYLAMDFGTSERPNPDIPTSYAMSDVPSGMEAMELVTKALRLSGLTSEIDAKAKSMVDVSYAEYSSRGVKRALSALGLAEVYRQQGLLTYHLGRTISDIWQASAAADITRERGNFATAIRLLEANSHTTADTEYDCNDLDDWSFVSRLGDDKGVLWLRTQHGQYRIDFVENQETRDLLSLTFSAQHDPEDYDYESEVVFDYDTSRKVMPDEKGFLGRVRWDKESNSFVMNFSGDWHSRTIKDLNGVILAIGSVACCLEQDYDTANDSSAKP